MLLIDQEQHQNLTRYLIRSPRLEGIPASGQQSQTMPTTSGAPRCATSSTLPRGPHGPTRLRFLRKPFVRRLSDVQATDSGLLLRLHIRNRAQAEIGSGLSQDPAHE